jgi:type I restriction enzyme, S subunit
MEVRHRYKQTEVGVIPEDWDVKPLRSCLSAQPDYGINAPAVAYSDRLPTYIRITDITEDGRFSSEKPVSVNRADTDAYYLNNGDIVFARTGASVGKSYLYEPKDGKLVFAGFLIRVRPDAAKLLPSYLSAYVTTGAYRKWVSLMSMRSGQPGINGQEYGQLLVPVPPLPEQRAIAEAVSDVDGLLGGLDRLTAKKRDLKQAAMQQLLTGQTRLPGFHGEWAVKRLGDVGEISSAGVDKKIRPDEVPVRLVNYLDVYRKDFIYADDLNHWVTAPPQQAKRCAVQKGDVFFTPTSETRDDIGISAVAMEDIPDAAYSYHVARLRLREPWDLCFRTYAFKTRAFLDQAETLCDGNGTINPRCN